MCDCRSVSACVSLRVCGCYTRASPAFVPRCAVFPPPPATRTHKVSFSQLAEGVEGGKGGEAGRGVGREVPQLRCPGRSSQPRSGARPAAPRCPGEGQDSPGRAARGGGEPGSRPATWHVGVRQGHRAGARAARRRWSPGAGGGSGARSSSDRSIPAPA